MENIEFINKRFNPDLTEFHNLAKAMAKSVGYTANLQVDKQLAQLLRLRVAQISECSYCIILHSKAARDVGVYESKVDNISSWYNSELYTKKEKVSLAYCDVLTEGKSKDFQNFHNNMTKYFSEEEIVEIASIVINMNLWTRLKLAQGATPILKED